MYSGGDSLCDHVIQCSTEKSIVDEVDKSKYEWNLELKIRIPDELLIEILLRLPTKSVCRYRVVCRHWHSLISSNQFITRYINHLHKVNGSHLIPNSFTLVFQDRYRCYSPCAASSASLQVSPVNPEFVLSKSYNCLHFIPPLMQSKIKPKGKYVKIKNADKMPVSVLTSCRDLLLCSRVSVRLYYVVNLVTKRLMVLPQAPALDYVQRAIYPKPGLVCYHSDGDAVASSYGRFKVVLASYPPEFGSSLFNIRIFCSETGEWTKVMADWYPWTRHSNSCSSNMFPHKGMLHWVNGYSLITLDLFNDNPGVKLSPVISLPVGEFFSTPNRVGITHGKLCVASHDMDFASGNIQVWQVEDHHKGVWRLLYRVLLPTWTYAININIMDFHPYKRDAVFVQIGRNGVYLFNLQNGNLDKCLEVKLDKDCIHIFFRPALVLFHQWFPTPLPSSSSLLV